MEAHRAAPHTALTGLLQGIVDYAGMFPPARLPFEEALSRFIQYRAGQHGSLLHAFVLPLRFLDELLGRTGDISRPVRLSLLLPSASGEELSDSLRALRRAARRPDTDVASAEFKVPEEVSPRAFSTLVENALAKDNDEGEFPDCTLFAEAHSMAGATEWASEVEPHRGVGLKIRCGGDRPDLYPSVDRLVDFVAACAVANVPFKATAGLHHAFPNFDQTTGGRAHGFINVFVGAAWLRSGRISADQFRELLDESEEAFSFDATTVRWRGHVLTIEEAEKGRRFARSFGSCSFEDPVEDLLALDVISEVA